MQARALFAQLGAISDEEKLRTWQSKRPAPAPSVPARFSRPSAARYSHGGGTRGTFAAVDEAFEDDLGDADDVGREEGSTGSVVDMNADLTTARGRWPSLELSVEGDWRRCSESI